MHERSASELAWDTSLSLAQREERINRKNMKYFVELVIQKSVRELMWKIKIEIGFYVKRGIKKKLHINIF